MSQDIEWWIVQDIAGPDRQVMSVDSKGRWWICGWECELTRDELLKDYILIRPLDISRGSDDAVCEVDTLNEQEQVE